MKLEYVYENDYYVKKFLLRSLWIALFAVVFWFFLGYVNYGQGIFSNELFLWSCGILCSMVSIGFGIIPAIIIYFINIWRRKNNNEIITKGVKKRGYIYGTNFKRYHYRHDSVINYKLLMDIDNKHYEIEWVWKNKIYKLLEDYIYNNPRKMIYSIFIRDEFSYKIYVDVYIYGNKFYADLDSIDLSIIEKTDI